jgi:hypothetical protein
VGYIRHHAIIVTGSNGDFIRRAHMEARVIAERHSIGGYGEAIVSPLVGPFMNGAESFFVAPDGSKEGWAMSGDGDEFREEFVEWLRAQAYDDGSSPLAWVEVQYGDDNRVTAVINHSDDAAASNHA